MNLIILLLRKIRAHTTLLLYSSKKYSSKRSLVPLSRKYGFDRGKPIDRYLIETFLDKHKHHIKGRVLEIVDNTYTLMFGKNKVTQSDVLDIYPTKVANIQDDLRKLKTVSDNSYDCLIITQTFNVIDELESAIAECYRILKVGGVMLVTLPTISPTWNIGINFWRFSAKGARNLFRKYFKLLEVQSLGNKELVLGFWVGMATNEFPGKQLVKNDLSYPLIIGVIAKKIK